MTLPPVTLTRTSTPLGFLTIAARKAHLVGAWLRGQRYFAAGLELGKKEIAQVDAPASYVKGEKISLVEEDAYVLAQGVQWMDRYFAKEKPDPTSLPLTPSGTLFQRRVWATVHDIPYGHVFSYGDIASLMSEDSSAGSARAVGSAVGRNPLLIFIPCHRVLPSSGGVGGYAGGPEAKRFLLDLESDNPLARYSVPRASRTRLSSTDSSSLA